MYSQRKRSVNIVRPRNRHNTLLQSQRKVCHKYQEKMFNLMYVPNDQARDKSKKDNSVIVTGRQTYKGTTESVVGDSMIKHINGYKMSKANTKVRVSSFPGSATRDMVDYVKLILRQKPSKLVLHVGTNILKSCESSKTCAKDIILLGESINRSLPETEIILSRLITRADEEILASKVEKVNAILKQ